jgi:Na+-translocating ferredoxin:NAD+ oxidoreductase RnfE subunit
MASKFLRLNLKDFGKGLIVAVLIVVLGALQEALGAHGLDFGAYNWVGILDVAWQAAAAYLVKNALSDEEGKVLGRIG